MDGSHDALALAKYMETMANRLVGHATDVKKGGSGWSSGGRDLPLRAAAIARCLPRRTVDFSLLAYLKPVSLQQ